MARGRVVNQFFRRRASLSQRLRDVGVGGRGEVEGARGERRGALVFVGGHHAVAFGECGFGALDFEIRIHENRQLFDHAAQPAGAGCEGEVVAAGLTGGGAGVEFFHVLKIQPGGERGDGIVEVLALTEGVEFGVYKGGSKSTASRRR